jgi:hypothetical protein
MIRIASTALLLHATSSVALAGIIYDATAEFSTTANANGLWSYHYSDDTTRDGTYDLFTQVGPLGGSGPDVWHASGAQPAQRPFIGVNTMLTPGPGAWGAGELGMHPGESGGGGGNGLAVLTWTSPFTGTADVSFSLAMGLDGTVEWFFEQYDQNVVTTHSQGTLIGSGATASITLADQSIIAGDQLNLVLNTIGSPEGDLVRIVSASIDATNAVPEPSTCFVSICIIAGLVLRKLHCYA